MHRNRIIIRDVPRDEAMAPAIAYLKTKYKGVKYLTEVKWLVLLDNADRLMSAAMIYCQILGIIQKAVDTWHGKVTSSTAETSTQSL